MTQQNLFETEVSISPMKAFLKKYNIKTHKGKYGWFAYWDDLNEWLKGLDIIWSDTEKDAIYELVKHYNIGNWKELNWD